MDQADCQNRLELLHSRSAVQNSRPGRLCAGAPPRTAPAQFNLCTRCLRKAGRILRDLPCILQSLYPVAFWQALPQHQVSHKQTGQQLLSKGHQASEWTLIWTLIHFSLVTLHTSHQSLSAQYCTIALTVTHLSGLVQVLSQVSIGLVLGQYRSSIMLVQVIMCIMCIIVYCILFCIYYYYFIFISLHVIRDYHRFNLCSQYLYAMLCQVACVVLSQKCQCPV